MNGFQELRTTTTNFKRIKMGKGKNVNDGMRVGISLTGFSYVSFPINYSFPVTIDLVFHIIVAVVVK